MDTRTAAFPSSISTVLITAVAGLVFAVYLGASIGNSDSSPFFIIGCVTAAILFAVWLHRFVWQLALFFIYSALIFHTFGFAFGGLELSCLLGVATISVTFWQKRHLRTHQFLHRPSFSLLQRALVVWIAYVAIHIYYNIKNPYRPVDFAQSNALKSYFPWIMPYFLLFYFIKNPAAIRVGPNFFRTVCRICLITLVMNAAIRIYEIATGTQYIFIPGLRIMDSYYALRGLGPTAMLLGMVGLCRPEVRKESSRLFWALLLLGTFGSALSAGRASLLTGIGYVCLVLLFRRRQPALLAVAGFALVAVIVINMFAHWINTKADPLVQRSLQWVLVEKNEDAMNSINNSSEWRAELIERTLAEWRSAPRIFWFGRATYSYSAEDEIAQQQQGGYEALMVTAQRRGATHNMISDLLIQYGIIGCILYLFTYFALTRFVWNIYRSGKLAPAARDLTLASLLASLFTFVVGIVGGGMFPADAIWFIVVIVAAISRNIGLRDRSPAASATHRPSEHAVTVRSFAR